MLFSFCAADVVEELERPDKLSPDDTSCCGSCVSKQLGDGEDGTECCGERMEEKQSGKCTEETSEQGRDSTLKNSEAEAVGNDGEVEVSCSSKLCSSREEPCYSSAEESLNPSKSGQRLKRQRYFINPLFFFIAWRHLDCEVTCYLNVYVANHAKSVTKC